MGDGHASRTCVPSILIITHKYDVATLACDFHKSWEEGGNRI